MLPRKAYLCGRKTCKNFVFIFVILLGFLYLYNNLPTPIADTDKNGHRADQLKDHNSAEHTDNDVNKLVNDQFSREHLEDLVQKDLAKQVPGLGDNGKSVKLTGTAKDIGEKQLAVIALNEELSEHLSYNRTTPDARHPACRNKTYDLDHLAQLQTSVIFIFFNEPYSVVVRSIHSVLNTVTDERLLKEIILVDDASTNVELKDKLDYYISTRLPKKVKMLRLQERFVSTFQTFHDFMC
jgi:polypeptide N-acetylgalactosaminyltransferase